MKQTKKDETKVQGTTHQTKEKPKKIRVVNQNKSHQSAS